MNTAIAQAVEEGNQYEIEDMVNAALAAGESPKDLLEALMAGLKACGDRFETGEFFLPELLGAGETFKTGMGILAPKLAAGDQVSQGKVVLGTVQGDVHDIGKNLVGFMLSSAGFTVVDVGTDVTPERFVQAVREHQPQVLGLSALLTTTMLGMGDVINELKKQGLRDKVKVIIGGGPVSRKYAEDIGADAYGNDAAQAVSLVRSLL
ncbi:cobalamin-binding protein [bacterium]|nr:MAG: cobalamin-binding protein [bacterium]